MTMRSKQWYTKTSRLSNSFANNSIGRLLPDPALANENRPGGCWSQHRIPGRGKGRKGFQRERNRRFRSLWAAARRSQSGRPNTFQSAMCYRAPHEAERVFLAILAALRETTSGSAHRKWTSGNDLTQRRQGAKMSARMRLTMVYKNERSPRSRVSSSGRNFASPGWEQMGGSEKHQARAKQAADGR